MAGMSPAQLRALARDAMLESGARGFMRFTEVEGALLATDAAARCADGGQALCRALAAAGFVCGRRGALLLLAPGDALLGRLCERAGGASVDWESPLHTAQAFALRLMRCGDMPLTDAGRGFVLDTARLLWQPEARVLAGLGALRAHAARLLRENDKSGFAPAGRLLANWADAQAASKR